ncbi:MAG: hypothetical protein U0835_18585 [Isosphaeraceae bacterium]
MTITPALFESQRDRRFGTSNPERMNLEFWEWMVRGAEQDRRSEDDDVPRTACSPYEARQRFGREGDDLGNPVWTFSRMGATRTPLPGGRTVCVGGEHEDYYDPDFCIYNDVIVLGPCESVEIYGYPKEVFPPTDFHTATRVGPRLIVIGGLGYMGERHPGTTPVYAVDLSTYRIEKLPSLGEAPGWVFKHEAEPGTFGGVVVRGGEVYEEVDGQEKTRRNFDDFLYDVMSGSWKRLTRRAWRQYSLRDEEDKVFMKGTSLWKSLPEFPQPSDDSSLDMPDVQDTFLWVKAESLRPRRLPFEVVASGDFTPEERLVVAGVPVSIKFEAFAIEVVVEGELDEAAEAALLEDIKAGVESETGRPLVLERLV